MGAFDTKPIYPSPTDANLGYPFPDVVKGKKFNYLGQWNVGANCFPHPDNDGKTIALPSTNTGNVVIYSTANVALYTVTPANVNASASTWVGFWLDTAEGYLYVFAQGASNSICYLSKLNYSNGTLTAIGSTSAQSNTFNQGSPHAYMIERATYGSGDFTIYNAFAGASSDKRYSVSISSGNAGVTVAEAEILSGGASLAGGQYRTADGALYASVGNYGYSGLPSTVVNIARGGRSATAIINTRAVGGMGTYGSNNTAYATGPMLWGPNTVIIGCAGTYSGTAMLATGTRIYSRSSFDAWLKRIADQVGLST